MYGLRMKRACWLPCLVGLLLSGPAHADRLINIPTGTKVFVRTLKLDSQWVPTNTRQSRFGLRAPIGQNMDVEIDAAQAQGNRGRLRLSAGYQLFVPIPDVAPGICVGIRDIGDEGPDGRSAYLAFTYKFAQEGYYNQNVPVDLTLGIGTGGLRGPFGGIVLPFADAFRLLAEYDTKRLTGGLEIRPVRDLSVQWLFREHETRLHLTWLLRW